MRKVLLAIPVLLATGCLAPNVVLVDRKTTLEQQAAGSYPVLATELDQTGIDPAPVRYTRAQIAAQAEQADAPVSDDADAGSDTARVDELLQRKCIGEALDGTLEETEDTCPEDQDADEVTSLVERVNRYRQEVWAYLQSQEPKATEQAVRAAWRQTRLLEVVCGGQIQAADGHWEVKKC